jgi:ABC-2 type transport system permease protein
LITQVFIPLLGVSGLYAFERQQGTLRRLFTTPTRQATFLLGTIGGQLGTALVQMTLLVLFGVWVMGLNWGRSPATLALILFTFALAAAAFGAMLGTFVKSEGQATGLNVMQSMVMALLGGWYPIELFPQALRTWSISYRAMQLCWIWCCVGRSGGGVGAGVLAGFGGVLWGWGVAVQV